MLAVAMLPTLVAPLAAGGGPFAFPSMLFFENGTNDTAAEAAMHKDQVELASQYALAIAGWGEDSASQPVGHREEEKLANISSLIKAKNPSTITAVYAGQFELVDPTYDLQAAIINDPAYDGFFLHDDDGKPISQNNGMRLWDFRNASAIEFHTKAVAGYFANTTLAPHTDAVFFDEGDSLACRYNCKGLNTCKTMPTAEDWHMGDLKAWVGAAKIMAASGRRAILSSQNSFNASKPELFKEGSHHCPHSEDLVVRMMKEAGVPFYRFYEYWLVPEQFFGGSSPADNETVPKKPKTWQFCRNQVANAVEEGKLDGVNFVAAGTSNLPGWATPQRLEFLEFSLAGFLIAQSGRAPRNATISGGRDYWGFDHQYSKQEMERSGCHHTRWGDCSHNPAETAAAFAKNYGVPVADAVELGGVGSGHFFRPYTNVNITFDCGKTGRRGATYTWLQ